MAKAIERVIRGWYRLVCAFRGHRERHFKDGLAVCLRCGREWRSAWRDA